VQPAPVEVIAASGDARVRDAADRESPGHQQILIEGCFDSR